MKTVSPWIIFAVLFTIIVSGCVHLEQRHTHKPSIRIVDSHDTRLESLETGANLIIGASGLLPGRSYDLLLRDQAGTYITMLRQTTDGHGAIAPQILWYQSGVVGCSKGAEIHLKLPYRFKTFEEAEEELVGRRFVIELRYKGDLLSKLTFPVEKPRGPVVYLSDKHGCLLNSSDGTEDIYVTGRNFLPGSIVELYLVPNQYRWKVGDRIQKVRHLRKPQIVTLEAGRTGFTVPVWGREEVISGAYDVIARPYQSGSDRALTEYVHHRDVIGWRDDVGIVVYDESETHLAEQIAGRKIYGYPWFEHVDGFPLGTDVWGALDPKRKPTGHPGTYAAWYVVEHKNAWTDGDGLADLSGGYEVTPIKPGCINHTWTRLWQSPMPTDVNESNPTKPYDVVIDFGNLSTAEGTFVSDGTYTEGTDFVDYYGTAGFYLVRDPRLNGSFGFTNTEESFGCDTDLDGITINWTDPTFYGATNFPVAIGDDDLGSEDGRCPADPTKVDMRARVYYPTKPASTDVADGGPFPVVVFYHGQQWPWSIPGYDGYTYLGELLASHGFIVYSIDARSLLNATMASRGEHIRAHMRKLVGLNATGSGSIFSEKLDLMNTAIVGHSRGGESNVAAWEWQRVQPDAGYAFTSLISIAPVQKFNVWASEPNFIQHMRDIPFMIIHGSKDGDVSDFQGLRLYDRAADIREPGHTPKAMVFVKDANHNHFNEVWETQGGDDYCCGGLLDSGDQRDTASVYIHAFLQAYVKNNPEYLGFFTGVIPYPGVATVATDFRSPEADHVTIDHHEVIPPATHNSAKNVACIDSLCGDVGVADITDYEERFLAINQGSPWSSYRGETYAASLSWDSSSDTYYTELPPGFMTGIDPTVYSHLSFRVGQVYPSDDNPADTNQNFAIRLRDTDNDYSPWVYVSDFATIHPAWQTSEGGIKTVMGIVRIPLQVFTVNTYSLLDLSKLDRIEFDFRGSPTGEVVFDDIEFSK